MDAPPIQYARTSDGVSIAYWVAGMGPAIVVFAPVHSNLELEWEDPTLRNFYERIMQSRTLLRFDPRGRGLSAGERELVGAPSVASDAAAAITAAGLDKVGLISPLGPVAVPAIHLAVANPSLVNRLLLWNPTLRTSAGLQHLLTEFEDFPELRAQTALLWRGYMDEESRERAMAMGADQLPSAGSVDADQLDWRDTTEPLLEKIQVPTLVVHSRGSPLGYTEPARELAAAISGARMVGLPRFEADIHLGDLDETMAIIDSFFVEDLAQEVQAEEASGGFQTILFTDLESSTALTQRVGDEAAQELLRGHNSAVRGALEANGGREVKHTGDGIMASFPSAVSAVQAGIAIQRELMDGEVRVRVGINAGEPIAEDDDLFGTAVQLAARITDRAEPGQVLVSNVVRELCAGKLFEFASMGDATLKGFDEPVTLYEVRV